MTDREEKMFGVFNLDSFINPDWTPERAPRVFPIDVFLSHNSGDESGELASELSRKGLNVWHDTRTDLVDRRVIKEISIALSNSRLIAICVPDNYRDSMWVRAEYLPALRNAERVGLNRVVVLKLHEAATAPAALSSCQEFEAYGHALDRFVDYARTANFLDISPFLQVEDQLRPLLSSPSPNSELLSDLASTTIELLAEAGEGMHSESYRSSYLRLYALRNILCDPESTIDPHDTDALLGPALHLLRSPDLDVRANGIMLIASLVDRNLLDPNLLIKCMAMETSEDVIGQALLTVSKKWQEITERCLIQIVALKAPDKVRWYPELLAEVPEVVMAFVFGKIGLDSAALSVQERSKWLTERLKYLVNPESRPLEREGLARVLPFFGITEYEVIFREFRHLIDEISEREEEEDRKIVRRTCLTLAGLLLSAPAGNPFAEIGDWTFDYVMVPILYAVEDPKFETEASTLFEQCCAKLVGTKWEKELSLYRKALLEVRTHQKRWDSLDLLSGLHQIS